MQQSDDLIFHGLDPNPAVEIGEHRSFVQHLPGGTGRIGRTERFTVHIEQNDINSALRCFQDRFQLLIVRQLDRSNDMRLVEWMFPETTKPS